MLPLDPRSQALQEAYIRKVVDTVHDLPNVLYEVANESSGRTADAWTCPTAIVIDTPIGDTTAVAVLGHRRRQGVRAQTGYDAHPIGMTFLYPVPDQARPTTRCGRARRIGSHRASTRRVARAGSRWLYGPARERRHQGRDLRHRPLLAVESDALWAWKSFLRGHNPILYDLGIVAGVAARLLPGSPSVAVARTGAVRAGRHAALAGASISPRWTARRPRSTGYALANPGVEYLVLQPNESGDAFTVDLAAGSYAVEWRSLATRETRDAGSVKVENQGSTTFSAPFAEAGPAVLHLKGVEG